jgi:hypothetical protein
MENGKMPMSRILNRPLALAALLAAAALLAGPARAARKPAEDKIPGFDGMYSTVQVTSVYWKDKRWEPRQTLTVGALKDFKPAPAAPRCQYGGLASAGVDKATGFFHAVKYPDRWTLIDPDGHPFITLGVDSVAMNKTPRGQAALKAKYGDKAGWAKAGISL